MSVHPIFEPILAFARGQAEPPPRMVRVVHESGESFVTSADAFVLDNADALTAAEIADIRAGRSARIGGGAAPIVTVELVGG